MRASLWWIGALSLSALPQGERPAVRRWEHERSDLPVDPRFRFGHFENGLRWVWARNAEPRYRSYLRLHVDAGSLAECEAARGMAHFLEHMAFNGSERFPAGTLVEWFQRHGMDFGADSNASTDFSETVYELDLPNSDAGTIGEGLRILRDFAFGLTLDPVEVEREKGVIDGEEREADSPGYRLFLRDLRARFGETRLDDRVPIGVREVRARFTAEALRAFYRRWYRPERMTLVLVGDLGDLDPLPLFEERFAAVPRPGEPWTEEPTPGEVRDLSHRLCLFEPEIPSVTLRIERIVPFKEKRFDAARWREEVPLQSARRMLTLRLEELAKEPEAPFLSAGLYSAASFRVLDGEGLTVSCAPERWREALALGERELRRALVHGFREAELEEVRAGALRALEEAVEREATQTSGSLVAEILRAAEEPYVPTSAGTRRAILRPIYESLTVEDCHRALVRAWSRGSESVRTLGNLDLGADAAGALDEALAESRAVEVEEGAEVAVGTFAYASSPDDPGAVVARTRVEDLDFVRVRFENGVALHVKRTDFREKQILFRAVLGEGRLSLPPADLPLGWMVDRVYPEGGLADHSIDELRRLLAGKQVGTSFSLEPDRFAYEGETTAEDLLLQCELACAFLEAPGWRPDGYVRLKREIPLLFEALKHHHRGPVATEFMGTLFSGDLRFAFFSQEALEAVRPEAVRDWLDPILADGPLEVTFVGDLDVEEVVRTAARTFGRLPERRALRAHEERRRAPAPKSGIHQVHSIDTEVSKSLVAIYFPVPDGLEVERERRFRFLSEILRDRLRVEVRERLGAAYSPTVRLDQSRVLPGVGWMRLEAMADPGAAEALKEAFFAVTDALAVEGVTAEEVERLREPILKDLRDARRQNGWWVALLSEAHRRPEALAEAGDEIASFAALPAEPLTALARTYLVRDRASTVIVRPRGIDEAPQPPKEGR